MSKELIQLITRKYSKAWELNDPAHRVGHFEEVRRTAVEINKRLELGFNDPQITFAAYFHDLFAWSRENHHILSHAFVMTTEDPLFDIFSEEDRAELALACKEHRASYRGEFSSRFSELINAADRERPSGPLLILKRALQYRQDRDHNNVDEVIDDAIAHVKDKYGTGGYARYPELYLAAFGNELRTQQAGIDALTADEGWTTYKLYL